MKLIQVGYGRDARISDPDELLDCYPTLTGWSEAVLAAGADSVLVVQRFQRDAVIVRRGVEYMFRRDRFSRRMHAAVAGRAPDVVHVNGLDFPLQTRLLRRALGGRAAIVLQDHGGHVPDASPLRRRIRSGVRRIGFRAADAFFFTASEQADEWRAAGLITARQPVYAVLESSTGLRPTAAAARRRLEGSPAILWVGRLNANKDPLVVLDGFERALVSIPGAVLTMVYQADDLLADVRARVEASPLLAARVRLVGRVAHDELPAHYTAADCFVLGSHRESAGYALIEACACGAAPVVTDIPPFRAITGGVIGALWRAGDAGDFARALVEVGGRDLPALRARVRERFDASLSWESVGRTALEAYRDVRARTKHLRRA